MQKSIAITVFILLVLGFNGSQADTLSTSQTQPSQTDAENSYTKQIYSWTDSKGVQHFSNKLPPEEAQNIKLIESKQSTDAVVTEPSEIKNRQDYDRMVENAKSEARGLENERKSQKAASIAEKKRQAEKERTDRVTAERKRLQNEIDAINARGLSPTFSQGMKDALIRKVQEQIDKLEMDPDTYFQSK